MSFGVRCHSCTWIGALIFLAVSTLVRPSARADDIPEETLTLDDLINLPESDLAKVDIAAMNLAAAEGLPGSEGLDRKAVLAKLDAWAWAIALVTHANAHLYPENPDYYENSWAKYCSIMLVLTLQRDLGVHYNFEQRTNPSLAKSKDQFIHGIVEGTGGTCASLPVLFVAIGRRLGYPMKLAQGKSHFFAKWDDPKSGEQFDIEGSNGGGLSIFDDKYYEQWPQPISTEELERGNYLESMSPREELSSFLTTRADCLRENDRWADAYTTYRQAVQLAPRNLFAQNLLLKTAEVLKRRALASHAEAILRQQELRRRTDPRYMIPGIPGMHSLNRGRYSPSQSFQPVGGIDALEKKLGMKLDGSGWQPPTMQDYLNETNRRNREMLQYGLPGLNPGIFGIVPTAPRSSTPNYGQRP